MPLTREEIRAALVQWESIAGKFCRRLGKNTRGER
jgi:hypothetical protein